MCSVIGMQTSNGSRASSWRRQPQETLLCSDPSNPPCTRSGLRFSSPSLPPSHPSPSLPPFPSPICRCWPGLCQKDIDAEAGSQHVRGGWEEGETASSQLPTTCVLFPALLHSHFPTFPLLSSLHAHTRGHTYWSAEACSPGVLMVFSRHCLGALPPLVPAASVNATHAHMLTCSYAQTGAKTRWGWQYAGKAESMQRQPCAGIHPRARCRTPLISPPRGLGGFWGRYGAALVGTAAWEGLGG